MFGFKDRHEARQRLLEEAIRRDFQRLLNDDADAPHRLALMLTADPEMAGRCFVAGLEAGIRGNPAFRQWARTWSKRAIIRNAIRILAPAPGQTNPLAVRGTATDNAGTHALMSIVWELPPFERFVFVVSILYGHSAGDSANLLGCSVADLIQARSSALARMGLACVRLMKPERRTAWLSPMAGPEPA